jgi:hypothetical protein
MSCAVSSSRRLHPGTTALCLSALLVAVSAAAQARPPQTLLQAIADGYVSVTVRGTGSSSGDAIELTISKTPRAGSAPLTLSVAPGTMLRSSSGSAQNMVVARVRGRMVSDTSFTPSAAIDVSSATPVRYLIEAYCTEFEKDNPSASVTFTLQDPDRVLACILRQGAASSTEAIQAAVWIHTDRVTFAHLNDKFEVSQGDWARAQAIAAKCAEAQ